MAGLKVFLVANEVAELVPLTMAFVPPQLEGLAPLLDLDLMDLCTHDSTSRSSSPVVLL